MSIELQPSLVIRQKIYSITQCYHHKFSKLGRFRQKKYFIREAAKKNPPLMAGPLRGGGGKVRAIKEKRTFFAI